MNANNNTPKATHTTHEVTTCDNCPLAERYYVVCRHPAGNELDTTVLPEPPEGCPLREHGLMLELKPSEPSPVEETP